MKVICDVHIPLTLVNYLIKQEVPAEHVNHLPNGYYTTDSDIANYADKHEMVVITKDIDFRNSYFIRQSPHKLIRICLGNITTADLITVFNKRLSFLKEVYENYPRFYL